MNLFTMLDEKRKHDLTAISARYGSLIDLELSASEARIEKLRELITAEKLESKARVDELTRWKNEELEKIELFYQAPTAAQQDSVTDEMAGVVVTGSAHNASEN